MKIDSLTLHCLSRRQSRNNLWAGPDVSIRGGKNLHYFNLEYIHHKDCLPDAHFRFCWILSTVSINLFNISRLE